MTLTNILVIHGRVRLGAKLTNMRTIRRYVAEVMDHAEKQVDLVVLPPYPFTGPVIGYYTPGRRTSEHLRASAEMLSKRVMSNRVLEFLSRLAQDYDVAILTGPMIERAGPRLYITSVYIDRFGDLIGKYRKIAITREESNYNISPGKEPGLFILGPSRARIGVFIDEDLAYSEIFRALQAGEPNIIIGFMLPYLSDNFKLVATEDNMLTMNEKPIHEFLSVRSVETGVPTLLVGGTVESNSNPYYAYTHTVIADPDVGIIKEMTKGPRDGMTHVMVVVNTETSRPKPVKKRMLDLCRKLALSK